MQILWSVAAEDASAIYNERVAIVLGFFTMFALLAVFFSCRTFLVLLNQIKIVAPANNRVYRKFNQYHSYYWWIFGVFLVAHFMMAFLHTGLPEAGDPDAPIHWAMLLLGLSAALAAAALLVSCRIMPRLISIVTSKNPMTGKGFRTFFRLHAYYWWVILLLVAAHFTVSYLHAGVWPK